MRGQAEEGEERGTGASASGAGAAYLSRCAVARRAEQTRLDAATCGCMRLTCGYMRLHAATCV